ERARYGSRLARSWRRASSPYAEGPRLLVPGREHVPDGHERADQHHRGAPAHDRGEEHGDPEPVEEIEPRQQEPCRRSPKGKRPDGDPELDVSLAGAPD